MPATYHVFFSFITLMCIYPIHNKLNIPTKARTHITLAYIYFVLTVGFRYGMSNWCHGINVRQFRIGSLVKTKMTQNNSSHSNRNESSTKISCDGTITVRQNDFIIHLTNNCDSRLRTHLNPTDVHRKKKPSHWNRLCGFAGDSNKLTTNVLRILCAT